MRILASIRALWDRFFHGNRVAADLQEELGAHIALRAEDLEQAGLSHDEAGRRARIEFGARERFREASMEELGGNFFSTLLQDFRFSFRILLKSPGFLLTAVATLALAIGANALVFGVLNGLILRPLNVPNASSLYEIENQATAEGQSYPDYLDFRDHNRSFESLAALTIASAGLDTGGDPRSEWIFEISGNYFDTLGVQPYLGRLLHSSDEHGPNSAPYMVLSYPYWHSHFHDDPGVVGRTIEMNKHPFTVIGVTPPWFYGTISFVAPDVFIPLVNQEQERAQQFLNDRSAHWCVSMTFGHLKPGVTVQQAAADLNAIGADLEKKYPKDDAHNTYSLPRAGLLGSFLGRPMRAFMTGMMLLAGLILLAACANLGSLFAARAADRSREVALRLALGSSRRRILRQLLIEALLVALGGGALGLAGSVALLQRLNWWQPFPRWPLHVPVSPDANVYAVALLLAVVSGILFGIVPVRQVLRANPYEVVKAGSLGMVGRRVSLRDVLLVAQIAICAVLVTSSLVAVRGLVRALHSNFGFDPQHVELAHTDLRMAGYSADAAWALQKRMIAAMETIPGVQKVGLMNAPPIDAGGWEMTVYKDATTDLRPANAAASSVFWYVVSPEYLDAAKTHLLVGRNFTWHDDKTAPSVGIVNRELATEIFGSATNAVGRHFKMRDGTRVEVVGVVEDGKYLSLTESPKPALFEPIQQVSAMESWLVVRTQGDPRNVASAMRAKIRELDSGLPADVQSWDDAMGFSLFPSRVATVSLGVLGLMGAMLSVTGIFGMAAYSVSKRLRELGIRIALGAQRRAVLGAALGRALRLLAIGSLAGLVLGLMATKVLAHIVYQATPRDPLVLTGVVVAMALLGLVATWLPAQKALSADPLRLLREE